MYEELENKIKSMTAKEIILSMVDALKNPVTRIDMDSFGHMKDNICFGCAATNQICKLGKLNPFNEIELNRPYNDNKTVSEFEYAIDALRLGEVYYYNMYAEYFFSEIYKPEGYILPRIDDDNYKDEKVLQAYIDLANMQPE